MIKRVLLKKITILFDLDGTLIDSNEAILLSFWDVLDDFSIKRAKQEQIEKLIGHTLEDMFLSLGVESNLVEKCVENYKKHYIRRALELTKLLPKAKEAIELAYSFASLGIVTTKTGKYSKRILEHLDVMKYFDTLIGREHVTHPKPHKEPIEKALQSFNSPKDKVWMIGDTSLDILSAHNAGVKCVGVLGGYGIKKELEEYADIVTDNVFEAVKFIYTCS